MNEELAGLFSLWDIDVQVGIIKSAYSQGQFLQESNHSVFEVSMNRREPVEGMSVKYR